MAKLHPGDRLRPVPSIRAEPLEPADRSKAHDGRRTRAHRGVDTSKNARATFQHGNYGYRCGASLWPEGVESPGANEDSCDQRRISAFEGPHKPGELGPWRKLEVRLGKGAGQKLPFYDTLDIEKGKSYTEGKLTHWKIEVTGDRFRVEVDGKKAVEGKDNTYNKAGYIGFILYAQSGVFFDNLVITDTFPVNPQDAFTTTWSQIKKLRLKNQ